MKCKKVCRIPFEKIEIQSNGYCYFCCPTHVKDGMLGNIFNQSFDEIFNGEKARRIRRELLSGDYSNCNTDLCFEYSRESGSLIDSDNLSEIVSYPKIVNFAHNHMCNFSCITCRDHFSGEKNYEEDFLYDTNIYTVFIPLLKEAKEVFISGSADPFASNHCQNLIYAISTTYPDIIFGIGTNGSLCTQENLENLKLRNRVRYFNISIHAATAETHKAITKTNSFDKVISNIKDLVKVREEGLDNYEINLQFVIHKLNWREVPDFIKMGLELNVDTINFWGVADWGCAEYTKNIKDIQVWLPENPEYNEFTKMLHLDILKHPKVHILQNQIKELMDI